MAGQPWPVSPSAPIVYSASSEVDSPVRKMAFGALLFLLFFRFSLLHEVMAYYSGASTYVLYLFSIPAVIGLTASGGFGRVFSSKAARFFVAFLFWMLLAVPFSTWRGDSTTLVLAYGRTHLPMMFFLGGLVVTWEECRKVFYTVAFAATVNVFMALALARDFGDRMGLEFGVVSNPNDFAAHVIFMLPMLFFVLAAPRIKMPLSLFAKLGGLAAVGTGLLLILRTASRGALIGLAIGALVFFWKSSMRTRVMTIMLVPLTAIVLFSVVPERARTRLFKMSVGETVQPGTSSSPQDEADESSRLRRVLLEQSIEVTFEHPLLGVGPGQFGNFEKRAALWRSTHNTYTQISSENGVPALVFLLIGLGSAAASVGKLWKRAKLARQTASLDVREIQNACFCLTLLLVMFCSTIFFLNFAYFFYLPALVGMMLAVSRTGNETLNRLMSDASPSPQSGFPQTMTWPPPAAPDPVAGGPAPVASRSKYRFNRYR